MSAWKVILATLVIFTAGLITGGVSVQHLTKPEREIGLRGSAPFIPAPLRNEYLAFMNRELKLAPSQYDAISNIVHQSQERVRILYDLIAPDLREELRFTREEIKAQLTPEQRRRFDEMPRKTPPRRPLERDRWEPRRPGPGDRDPLDRDPDREPDRNREPRRDDTGRPGPPL